MMKERRRLFRYTTVNPLSANTTKWSNTLKQFVGNIMGMIHGKLFILPSLPFSTSYIFSTFFKNIAVKYEKGSIDYVNITTRYNLIYNFIVAYF